jgi:ABC-type amino acid transport substrate-binding protein
MKILLCTIVVGMAFLSSQSWADTSKLNIITEQYQPYNFIDPNDGSHKMQGIAVDLLVEMLKKTGSSQSRKDIQMQPWARGYEAVKNEKNTLLFSTTRTKERENSFKWACPINEIKTEVIALKSSNIKIGSKKDLIKYQIGSVRDDVGEQLVVAAGVPLGKLKRTAKYESNLKKLQTSRIDLYVGSMDSIDAMCKNIGCSTDAFESVYTLDVSQLCFAFNKKTSDSLINPLQKALDELVTQGKIEELHEKYKAWK